RSKTTEQTTSLLANNAELKAQIQEKVTITDVPKADRSKSSSSFLDSKNFVCSTCHRCVFNANHDACIPKLLKEVNSRAKIQSNKTTNSNKPVDQKSHTQKPSRQIFTGHRFSPNKTSAVSEKTSPRSDLRQMTSAHNSSGLKPQCQMMSIHNSSGLKPQCQTTFEQNGSSLAPHQCQQSSSAAEQVTRQMSGCVIGSIVRRIFQWRKSSCFKVFRYHCPTKHSNKHQQQPDSTSPLQLQLQQPIANGNFDL
ncbi:hypothetical protein Tco_0219156, partial [Tanacetum coccineum]